MSFHLMAFFAKADETLMEEAMKKWPKAKGKAIDAPFKGIGIASPYINKADNEEEYEKANDIGYDLEEHLPEFSKQHPETVFVFVGIGFGMFGPGSTLCLKVPESQSIRTTKNISIPVPAMIFQIIFLICSTSDAY